MFSFVLWAAAGKPALESAFEKGADGIALEAKRPCFAYGVGQHACTDVFNRTPHVGGAVRASRERAYEVVAAQLARLAAGQPLLNVINAEGY